MPLNRDVGRGSRIRIVIPDDINGAYAAAPETERLRAAAEVDIHATRAASETELAARIRDATVVLSFRPAFTRFPESVLQAAPQLRMICISGTGVEDVDVAAATARGIAVANVVGAANRAVAELCLALMLAVARAVPWQDQAVRRGEWTGRQGIELGGKVLGIVGLSAIARELCPMAQALGMHVISWSRDNDPARAAAVGSTAVPLDELLQRADVISLHARLTDATRHMIGAERLALMKDGAILINTGRGGLIDEPALLAALQSGKLAGAGLDVFAAEPLPAGHPLLAMDNVVMTPVSAWNTVDASARMIRQSIDNVVAFLSGTPVNVVNPQALQANKIAHGGGS
jgi:phosphoglycerate dehydrogenase-like enzyme